MGHRRIYGIVESGGLGPGQGDYLTIGEIPDGYLLGRDGDEIVGVDPATLGGGGSSGAPVGAQYVVVANDGTLTVERVLAVSAGLTLVDGGAGGSITVILDAGLQSLTGADTAANLIPYTTGVDTWGSTSISAFARTLLADTTASAWRTDLGLVIGTNVQAWDADLDAIAALGGTGYGKRSGGTWTLVTAASIIADILTTKGDILAFSTAADRFPVGSDTQIIVADSTQTFGMKWTDRYKRFVITSTGYTTVSLPTDCRVVRFTVVGSGGSGGGGTTGDNTANRAGGGGGGTSGWARAQYARSELPDSVEVYVGAGVVGGTPAVAANGGLASLVETTNTAYTGTTTPQQSSTLIWSGARAGGGAQGVLGGTGGTAGTASSTVNCMPARAADFYTAFAGNGGGAGGASGTPTAATPFPTTTANLAGGCGGAGKASAGPTQAAGGGYAAFGHLAAISGGAAGGTAGTDGVQGGHGTSTVDESMYAYGGTGGGSNTAGTGGTGGKGNHGSGGAGGGAGTTSGGSGGDTLAGYVIIECYG